MALVALEWAARFGDVAGQLALLDERLALETRPGDLVLLPELCLTGYVSPRGSYDVSLCAEDLSGPTTSRLGELARSHGITLVGPLVERLSAVLHNTIVGLAATGERLFVYRKRHPWYPETWATAGDDAYPLFVAGELRLTACICFDLHFLETEGAAALRAADGLLFASAWVEDDDSRERRLTNLARAYDLVVVHANWAPGDVRLAGQGRSMIVTRDGVAATADEGGSARLPWPPLR